MPKWRHTNETQWSKNYINLKGFCVDDSDGDVVATDDNDDGGTGNGDATAAAAAVPVCVCS